MRDYPKLEVTEVSYHRNGIGGEGFYAVLFEWNHEGRMRKMVASVFDGPGQCACYDISELAADNIAFANGNSWRGDHFEGQLREAIAKGGSNRLGPFAMPQTKKAKA